jgi:hypothetical protein
MPIHLQNAPYVVAHQSGDTPMDELKRTELLSSNHQTPIYLETDGKDVYINVQGWVDVNTVLELISTLSLSIKK